MTVHSSHPPLLQSVPLSTVLSFDAQKYDMGCLSFQLGVSFALWVFVIVVKV